MGAAVTSDGPEIGDTIPLTHVEDSEGRPLALRGNDARDTLLVFVSPGCSSCKDVFPAVKTLARSEAKIMRFIVASVTEHHKNHELADELKKVGIPYVSSPDFAHSLNVMSPPYAVLIDSEGVVRTKGMTNHIVHLESLINAYRSGK